MPTNCGTRDCSAVNWDSLTGKGIRTVLLTPPTPQIVDKYWWWFFFLPGYTAPWLIISNYLNTGAQLGLGSDTTILVHKSKRLSELRKQDDKDATISPQLLHTFLHLKFLNPEIKFPHPHSPKAYYYSILIPSNWWGTVY